MKCKNVRRYLSAFQDGELDKSTTRQIQHHVHHCADCEEALQQLQKVYKILEAPVVPPVPVDFQIQLDAGLRARRHSIPSVLPRRSWLWAPAGIVTAVFLGITLAGIVGNELLKTIPPKKSARIQLDDHFTVAPPGSITKTYLETTNP